MPVPPPPLARLRGLVKHYGTTTAVDGFDLSVGSGEIVGLLGRNGAGKTTVLECLLGLRAPDAGEVELVGSTGRQRPRATLRQVGALLQPSALQDRITPREALRFHLAAHAVSTPAEPLLQRLGLLEKADTPFANLSTGQRQRLALALALAHRPVLLVLDEPASGLDPRSRQVLHELLQEHRASGGGVLLSTHDLDEAERLCDRVVVVHRGRSIAAAPPAALVAASGGETRIRFSTTRPLPAPVLLALGASGVPRAGPPGDDIPATHELVVRDAAAALARLTQAVQADGNELVALHFAPPTLEDAFVALTGERWSPADSAG